MEGLFPLSPMVAGGRVFGKEGKGLPSTSFDDHGNGNAATMKGTLNIAGYHQYESSFCCLIFLGSKEKRLRGD